MKYHITMLILFVLFVVPLPLYAASTLDQAGGKGAGPVENLQTMLSDQYNIDLYGFIELRNGWRLQNDPYSRRATMAEARLRLDLNKDTGWAIFKLKGDLGYDLVMEEGIAELREANVFFPIGDFIDMKVGRQVLTWGTGDLLFINDLFPKNWQSFFIGRDDEYLKEGSDAVRASIFLDFLNIDLVYVPEFNNSIYISGERLSYWNGILGRTAGRDHIINDRQRNSFARDSEYAIRLSKNIDGNEFALYGYHGFWKTPEGVDMSVPADIRFFYPRLSVYGASVRGRIFAGIGNIELGYYDSRSDRSGNNPAIRNSEIRFLAGYEQELGRDFTGGFQYYLEWKQDYNQYLQNLRAGTPAADEYRHLLTVRLTKLLMNQNLILSLFSYYSPSDNDAYLRTKGRYKFSDRLTAEIGANIFFGSDAHTFFGQFADNTNAYAGLRFSF